VVDRSPSDDDDDSVVDVDSAARGDARRDGRRRRRVAFVVVVVVVSTSAEAFLWREIAAADVVCITFLVLLMDRVPPPRRFEPPLPLPLPTPQVARLARLPAAVTTCMMLTPSSVLRSLGALLVGKKISYLGGKSKELAPFSTDRPKKTRKGGGREELGQDKKTHPWALYHVAYTYGFCTRW
jgi:hypothetical protein